jgi:branched-subunit amino acid aminotransferase/4-amino-4-deoxychorismate lyase
MEFKNIKQEVFELKDIKTLVETLRVEVNEDFAVCYDLEAHAQRLLGSILELDFELAKGLESENFTFFLLNQIKNKLQYEFNRQVAFTYSQYDENLNLHRLSNGIYKLRIIYQKNASLKIELDQYNRDLSKDWKIKILTKDEFHIESLNRIWQHKFLPRPDFSYYLNQGFDEIIWGDENENICEASFTAIVYDNNKSPLANTLPSVSISQITGLKKLQCKKKDLKEIKLVNSLIGVALASEVKQ